MGYMDELWPIEGHSFYDINDTNFQVHILNRAVMEAIHRITRNEGDFVGAFRQNVIRVIGSYGREQQPDEYTDRIKAKQEEMVALIAENARTGAYTQEFDERYRRIAEEINALKGIVMENCNKAFGE